MFQTSQREIRQNQPVGAQFLEEIDLPDLLGKAFGGLARRHGGEPFAPADPAVLNRHQKARYPKLPRGRHGCRDELEQDLFVMPPRGDHETPDVPFVMPPRGDHETPDVPLAEQEVMMLDQPRPGARY
jgi:hypothetical protein